MYKAYTVTFYEEV